MGVRGGEYPWARNHSRHVRARAGTGGEMGLATGNDTNPLVSKDRFVV